MFQGVTILTLIIWPFSNNKEKKRNKKTPGWVLWPTSPRMNYIYAGPLCHCLINNDHFIRETHYTLTSDPRLNTVTLTLTLT